MVPRSPFAPEGLKYAGCIAVLAPKDESKIVLFGFQSDGQVCWRFAELKLDNGGTIFTSTGATRVVMGIIELYIESALLVIFYLLELDSNDQRRTPSTLPGLIGVAA